MQDADHINILPVNSSLPWFILSAEIVVLPKWADLWYPFFAPINGSSFYSCVNYEGLRSIENNLDSLQEQPVMASS